jgi:hypothetical protein
MRVAGAGTYIVSGGYAWVNPYPGTPRCPRQGWGADRGRAHAPGAEGERRARGRHADLRRDHPGAPLDADIIADTYWDLHNRPSSEWTDEIVIAGE